jgi:hypothetical protein
MRGGFLLIMEKLTVNNHEYDIDSLSDNARSQLVSLQFVDQEIVRLQALLAAMQTARNAYAMALQESLPALPDKVFIA